MYGVFAALVGAMFKSTQYLLEKKNLAGVSAFRLSWANRFYSMLFLIGAGVAWGCTVGTLDAVFWGSLAFCGFVYVYATLWMRQSVKEDAISEIFPLLATQPLLVIPMAYVLLGELPGWIGTLGIVILVLGVYLLNMKPDQESVFAPVAELWHDPDDFRVILVVLLFALANPVAKMGVRRTSPLFWTIAVHVFQALYFTIWFSARSSSGTVVENVLSPNAIWLAVAFFSGGTVFLKNLALDLTLVSYVAAIMQSSIFFTVLIGGILWQERDLQRRLTACSLVVVGNVIIVTGGVL